MTDRNPETNFEALWRTFNNRYPFFELRGVDWEEQYHAFRPLVTSETGDDQLFEILCSMLAPLNDGHVELLAGKDRYFRPERTPRFYQEFSPPEIQKLWQTTEKTLAANGFGTPEKTAARILHYGRSEAFGYIRILELEGVSKRHLETALDEIDRDLPSLSGIIIDIRDCPGGDDSVVIAIIGRFCDRRRIAFHRRSKTGPSDDDYSPLKTWHIEPRGTSKFSGSIVLLTCDSVFSGGEVFALCMRELPNVTVVGEHTNGIFSYQLEKKLPNGWEYRLSYQKYFSADLVCYEGVGVPVDIELLNTKADIETGADPLILKAIELLQRNGQQA